MNQENEVNEENEENEEEKQTIQIEEQKEESTDKPIYNSIRERYAKVLEKEKQEKERVRIQHEREQVIIQQEDERLRNQQEANDNTEANNYQHDPNTNIIHHISSQLNQINGTVEGVANQEQENRGEVEDERDAQGIIQLLSSQLLSQILSAGDLFHSHIAERFEREVETMKQKFYSLWFENILKVRIFLSDRHEKVERALQKIGFLPKNEEKQDPKETVDDFDIEIVDLEALENSLNDASVLKQIYEYILNDDENYD